MSALERLLADNQRLRSEAAAASAELSSAGLRSQEQAEAHADTRASGSSPGGAAWVRANTPLLT